MKYLPQNDLHEIVDRSINISEQLANSKILITGSTGFIGSWLATSIIELNEKYGLGIELFLPIRNRNKAMTIFGNYRNSQINLLEIDYLNASKLPNIEVSHIIFSSTPSQPSTGGNDESLMKTVSSNSFESLVEISRYQKNPPMFCNLSSGAVYGKQILNKSKVAENPLTSHNQICDLSSYGKIKIKHENEVEKLTNRGQILGSNPRLFAFSGPGIALDAHFAIGNFMSNALNGEIIDIKGNPNTQRSYLYPTDLIVWILNLLIKPTLNPIHIGSEHSISMSDLAQKISKIFSSPGVSIGDFSTEMSIYVPETSQTRELLNVTQEVLLDESLLRWKQWLVSQPWN